MSSTIVEMFAGGILSAAAYALIKRHKDQKEANQPTSDPLPPELRERLNEADRRADQIVQRSNELSKHVL